MGYPCDPQDVWEEGTEDAIAGVHDHGNNIRKEWTFLDEHEKFLLNMFQEELIKRLKVSVFTEVS